MNKQEAVAKIIAEADKFVFSVGYENMLLSGGELVEKLEIENINESCASYLKLNSTNASNNNKIVELLESIIQEISCGDSYNYDWYITKKQFETFRNSVIKIHEEYKGVAKKSSKVKLNSQKVKDVGRKVIVRKVARNMTNKGQKFLVDYLAGPNALNDSKLKSKITDFLSTDLGRGIFAGAISMVLDMIPAEKLPGGENIAGVLSEISDELKVQAGDHITLPLEDAFVLLLPMLKETLMPLLSQADIKQLSK